MIRLDISSPEFTIGYLRRALSDNSDRAEIAIGDKVIGVLVPPKRLRQLEALEWLASDPHRIARLLDEREAAEKGQLEVFSLSEVQ